MKVALVYDRVNKWGGAERVLLALHEIFPKAPLYTSVYDKKNAKWAKVFPEVKTTFLQKLPFAKNHHEILAPLMPWAFESFDFSGFDLVISVTSEAAKGIKTGPKTVHICYCLTPTRYLWSHRNQYLSGLRGYIASPLINFLSRWDTSAAKRPDIIIGISSEVKKRIKKYYKREAEIIYPPTEIKKFKISKGGGKQKYYLIVSRLVKYKKIDLAINVFNKLKYPLVIVGTGNEEKKLKKMASKNIKFAGFTPEKKLVDYYSNAKALIMPQEEDFGLVSVEAQSYGLPIISYKKGGAIDTVIPGKTGLFFEEQNMESLTATIQKFEKHKFDSQIIIKNANRFTKKEFKKRFLDLTKKMVH